MQRSGRYVERAQPRKSLVATLCLLLLLAGIPLASGQEASKGFDLERRLYRHASPAGRSSVPK